MVKQTVTTGVYLVKSNDNNLRVLCGCPVDVIKLLLRRGFIYTIENDGNNYEVGPNAILLSDLSIQNGQLSNMIEFPILHMQFKQGMSIPNHPNNDGRKPMVMGLPQQLESQCRYFIRGKYGLISDAELLASGIDKNTAEQIIRFKRRFNYGKIEDIHQLLDLRAISAHNKINLSSTLSLQRQAFNVYEFCEDGEQLTIDMNLASSEYYESPYNLSHHPPAHDYFSIVHLGEGNGWDCNRPNMCSLICYQGKYYLIDAPAAVDKLLQHNGISVNEVEGIFHSHSHDDHFAGLPSLIKTEHPIKYYATSPVRHSVIKKFTALLDCHESMFHSAFTCYDLTFDCWNDIGGLQVLPCLSPHPVETSLFYFRTLWHGGYKTYGHLADIGSDRILKKFITNEKQQDGISAEFYQKVKTYYTFPADLKKIDVGGGLIHGEAEDFRYDRSQRIILSHTEQSLSPSEREIGSSATFGLNDILIPSQTNLMLHRAYNYLKRMFPAASSAEFNMLLNQPIETLNVGSIVLKKSDHPDSVLLLISGTIERINADRGLVSQMAAGSFIGHIELLHKQPSDYTYYATSYIKVLGLPSDIYRYLVCKYRLEERLIKLHGLIHFLQQLPLFDSNITDRTLGHLAEQVRYIDAKPGTIIKANLQAGLYLVHTGVVALFEGEQMWELYVAGGIFGEESILSGHQIELQCEVIQPSQILFIPAATLRPIPSILWQLHESLNNKLSRMSNSGEKSTDAEQ